MPRTTLSAINAELARRGHAERLVRGAGYFYFVEGNADAWFSASVLTMHLGWMTVAQWADERDTLAAADAERRGITTTSSPEN